jgi:hypothetical protein
MRPTITLLLPALAVSETADLRVVALHAGGFAAGVEWELRIVGDLIDVCSADAARE